MRFESGLVREQVIETAIEAILVALLVAELQQIATRRAAIPILGNVQLARRLADPRRHKNRRHLRPGDALLARWKQPLAPFFNARPAPQREPQIHIAKLTRALDAKALQTHRHRQIFATIPEKLRLLRDTNQPARKRACLNPSMAV